MIRLLRQGTVWLLQLPVRCYRLIISPLIGPRCRFVPSCSEYALDALRIHGPLRGLWLAVWRVLRCNPLNLGGFDPVPPRCGQSHKAEECRHRPKPRPRHRR